MRRNKNKIPKRNVEVLKDLIISDDLEKLGALIELVPSIVNCQFKTQDGGHVCYWTPLCWAVKNGSLNAIQILIEQGADMYYVGCQTLGFQRSSFTAYSLAMSVPYQLKALKKLLELGIAVDQPIASPEVTEEEGGRLSYAGYVTGLHYAVCSYNLPLSQLLLQHGASVHKLDKHGNTALHLACENASSEIIKLLAFYGGIDNSINTDCLSPFGLLWQSMSVTDRTATVLVIHYLIATGYNLRTDLWYRRNSTGVCELVYSSGRGQQPWGGDGSSCACLHCLLHPFLCNPCPLKVTCRSVIRRYLCHQDNPSCPSVLTNLPLPPLLRSFLMFEDGSL